jgi:hypothetical protein
MVGLGIKLCKGLEVEGFRGFEGLSGGKIDCLRIDRFKY